jgi:hypothetical protein
VTPDPDTSTDQRGRHAHTEDDDTPDEKPQDEKQQDAATEDGDAERPQSEDDASTPSDAEAEPEKDAQTPQTDAKTDDAPTPPPRTTTTTDAAGATRAEPEQAPRQRAFHSIGNHPAGFALLLCSGLVTGIALAPLLFDQLRFDVATDAARAARSAATSWPAGGEPWFWPSWLAAIAALVAVAVLVLAILGLRVPDLVVLGFAIVLTLATARAAWATLSVINSRLWELVPLTIVCVAAFGLAATALLRWRSPDEGPAGGGGEAAAVAVGGWLIVALLLLAGAAIARSAETNAGSGAGPPQGVAGLLSVRSADGPQIDDLEGSWAPQLSAAQVTDDTASAYSAQHATVAAGQPVVLVRGDDVDADDLDDTWWLTLGQLAFGSQEEAAAWCASAGPPGCVPRLVAD